MIKHYIHSAFCNKIWSIRIFIWWYWEDDIDMICIPYKVSEHVLSNMFFLLFETTYDMIFSYYVKLCIREDDVSERIEWILSITYNIYEKDHEGYLICFPRCFDVTWFRDLMIEDIGKIYAWCWDDRYFQFVFLLIFKTISLHKEQCIHHANRMG